MLPDEIKRLKHTLQAGEVSRYHAVPTVRPQTDGLHCWNMLVLALYIVGPNVSQELLREIVMHDTGELVAGDTPYTVKRDNPALKTLVEQVEQTSRMLHTVQDVVGLCPYDQAILKICDTLEGFIWCQKYENVSRIPDETTTEYARWTLAYHTCRNKWWGILSKEERERCDEAFKSFGGILRYEQES